MARDIGPEMLEILDDALAKGQITQARYDAKRAEVLERIRQGKAVELEPRDRVLQGLYLVGGVAVLILLSWAAGGVGTAIGIIFVVMMIIAAARVGRR